MKITLTSIKYMASLSEETPCYSATLLIDGKRIGTVSNHGHGGSDECDFGWSKYRELDAAVAVALPEETYQGYTYKASLEGECHRLVNEYLALRDLRRLLKKSIVFRKAGSTQLNTIAVAAGPQWVLSRYPDAVVLNSLPESEALAAYLAAT